MKNDTQNQGPIPAGMAKAESNITNLEKGQEKIESRVEKMEDRLKILERDMHQRQGLHKAASIGFYFFAVMIPIVISIFAYLKK